MSFASPRYQAVAARDNAGLSLDEIRRYAPSVFATQPWNQVSENYRFVPTFEVFSALQEKNFACVYAGQSKARLEGKGEFTRHVMRFRHPDMPTIGDSVPELVLLNSHDRSSAYKLMFGVFRMVCANGIISCSSSVEDIVARHSGRKDLVQEVIEGSFRVIENAPAVAKQIDDWRNIELSQPKQLAYAAAALELRNSDAPIDPAKLLDYKREEDRPNTVWHTFNRVQENLIRGGQGYMSTNAQGRRSWRHARGVKSVNEDVKLNRALWRLTEELAKAA